LHNGTVGEPANQENFFALSRRAGTARSEGRRTIAIAAAYYVIVT
jgi:hypothetical protein